MNAGNNGSAARRAVTDQLELPFLTPERAAVVDAARVAVERAQHSALAARRWADADELARLGTQLDGMLHDNATARRGAGGMA